MLTTQKSTEKSQTPTTQAIPHLSQHRRHVFVIEDDIELSTVLERILRAIDPRVEIEWATSAEEATARLARRAQRTKAMPYDLIVADIFLEGQKTGLDFWRTCSQVYPDIPLVVTSALPVDKYFTTLGPGTIAPPFLAKPFSMSECKHLFEAMLDYSDETRKKRRPTKQ